MHQFKEKLAKLVGAYQSSSAINLPALESDFILLIAETMSVPPLTTENINKISKQLFLQFHSDKSASFSPDVRWLESALSQGRNDGACFKLITLCKERLIAPKQNQADIFDEAENIDDLKAIFETLKKQSTTHIQAEFYSSLIAFIDECTKYDKKIEAIKYNKLKLAVKFLPLFCPNYLITIFHTELIALYAISLLSILLGYSAQIVHQKSLNQLGNSMITSGFVGLSGTSLALVRIYEMSYWICGNSYDLALQAGSVALKAICPPETQYFFHDFQSNAIQKAVRPFQIYLKNNEQQYFREARLGGDKRKAVLKLLENARDIDKLALPESELLDKLKLSIEGLKKIPKFNTKTLGAAINESYYLINAQQETFSFDKMLILGR